MIWINLPNLLGVNCILFDLYKMGHQVQDLNSATSLKCNFRSKHKCESAAQLSKISQFVFDIVFFIVLFKITTHTKTTTYPRTPVQVLRYMTQLKVEETEDIRSGYKIVFEFKTNPFFENTGNINKSCVDSHCSILIIHRAMHAARQLITHLTQHSPSTLTMRLQLITHLTQHSPSTLTMRLQLITHLTQHSPSTLTTRLWRQLRVDIISQVQVSILFPSFHLELSHLTYSHPMAACLQSSYSTKKTRELAFNWTMTRRFVKQSQESISCEQCFLRSQKSTPRNFTGGTQIQFVNSVFLKIFACRACFPAETLAACVT